MKSKSLFRTRKLIIASLMVAVGLLLPYAAGHAFGIPGTVLLPMHIPVLLCGFLCGPRFGALCGLLVPVLSSLLTGMPPAYPVLPSMAGELVVYGLVCGLTYETFGWGKHKWGVFPSLLMAMAAGRVVSMLISAGIAVANVGAGAAFAAAVLAAGKTFVTGLPGVAIQLVLIPVIVKAVERFTGQRAAGGDKMKKALALIAGGEVSCVVIRNNEIIHTADGRGVKPLMDLYKNEPDKLEGALVVDKIIGKAAATILILGGVKAVHGEVMSSAGKSFLEQHGVAASYGRCVDVISNRVGNGICPIERSVLEVDDLYEGFAAISATIEQLMAGKSTHSAG